MGLGLRDAARLSFKNLRRRSAVPLLLALMVPSASIMVPLTMGDSFQQSLRADIYDSLGPVDEVVRSQGMMRLELFESLENDTGLARLTDGLAPALILPGIITGPAGDRRDTQVDIIGIDGRSSSFGALRDVAGGAALPHSIGPGVVYLREDSAKMLGASAGDVVSARFRDPVFSLESIYTPGAPVHEGLLNVTSVIKNEGLGALNLVPRGDARRTAYVDLEWLMEASGSKGMNAILVSNNGDARGGVSGTADVAARLGKLLKENVGYEEGGYILTAAGGYVKLENERIFFDEKMANELAASDARVSSVSMETSYFVNMIMANGSWIAYSTVTAFDPALDAAFGMFSDNATGLGISGELADDEIIVTGYAAGRLGLKPGDNVTLNFTVYDHSFRQQLRYENFRVKHVVDIAGKADDPGLMPPFPGIKGTVTCGDWKPPIPINFSIMVPADLDFWRQHAGTPKAYISLSKGRELWGNDIGNLTTVKALPVAGVNATELATIAGNRLNASLSPQRMGVIVENIKQDSIDSVAGLDIVTEALMAFGSAVTASGMVLIYVVVMADIEARRQQIGILRSLGFTRKNVAKIFTLEGTALSLAGSAVGLFSGIAFAGLGVWASNNLWTQILPISSDLYLPGPLWMAASFVAGFILSTLAFAVGARASARGDVVSNIRGLPDTGVRVHASPRARRGESGAVPYPPPEASRSTADGAPLAHPEGLKEPSVDSTGAAPKRRPPALWPTATCIIAIPVVLGLGIMLSATAGDMVLLYYFLVGDLILVLAGYIIYAHMEGMASALSKGSRLGRISLANSARNRKRSGAYVMAYALVIFPLLTLSAYLPMETGSISDQAVLRGGGYDILGTSEVPVFFDLGDAAARDEHNVTGFPAVSVVQFLSFGSPGGTCSNLNTEAPPRILGANASFIAGSEIPFSSSLDGSAGKGPWKLLDKDGGNAGAADGSVVPVIGDYTTIVWIFEKGLGGTIRVTDEFGHAVVLKIVAILHDSIFQGSVFLSEPAMKRLYPTQSQYNMFIFKIVDNATGGKNEVDAVAASLEASLSSYGFGATSVKEMAAGFILVDMAYVSMLQAMLASGIMIGTLGFAAKAARETTERRFELGVMRAIGFSRGRLERLVLGENIFIFLLGFCIALSAAVAASSIFLGSPPSVVDSLLLLGILLAVIAISTVYPVRRFNALPAAGWLRIPH
jgi:ABC-type antimicrobial peptide transport system permease subunit